MRFTLLYYIFVPSPFVLTFKVYLCMNIVAFYIEWLCFLLKTIWSFLVSFLYFMYNTYFLHTLHPVKELTSNFLTFVGNVLENVVLSNSVFFLSIE